MTPTPPTNNGRVLERIMRLLWSLPSEQYNRLYVAILAILDEEYEEPTA